MMPVYIIVVLLMLRCTYLTVCIPPTAVLPPGVMEAHRAKLSFFKASVCEAMLERLVGHYLLLSEEELENWNTNTEEFCEYSTK